MKTPSAWLVFAVGPLAFLVGIFALSAWFSARGAKPEEIGSLVSALVPHILLGVQIVLALAALWLQHAGAVRWGRLPRWNVPRLTSDLAVGAAAGAVLAGVYLFALAPLLAWLQANTFDYVPPGEILPALSRNAALFFLANVALAPFTEEIIYRGFALPYFRESRSVAGALVLSCLLFGLLHWAGGFWYIVLTGFVAGGLFAGLYLWRDGLVAPIAAHFVMNAIEFGWAR